MGELELVGLHEDGEHLVLMGPDGQRFRLRIDEPLRAAVRRDRPQLEQLRAERAGTPSPREIQTRIRSGRSAQDVADSAGIAVEHVRRYEGPVLAEREFISGQARVTRVGRETGAPVLGDLVTDRLAARGVDVDSIEWDAYREGSGPWTVVVRFRAGDDPSEALWSFDTQARSVLALDDEARWLSETELADEPIPRRHLAAVRDAVFDVQADGSVRPVLAFVDAPLPASEPEPRDPTDALLDDLRTKRGVRQQLDLPDDDDDGEAFEGFGPPRAFDFGAASEPPAAHPAHSDPTAAQDTHVLPRPAHDPSRPSGLRRIEPETPVALEPNEPHPDEREQAVTLSERPRSGRRGRASVPSWDEIVFGAKPE
ncbi:septation protein SepH [Pengzhenrongella frigida]|uniref:DUF3071 domain-containing protein n=1 Tax=Pengzhenrongella frigida TaxID=1259133 RepID=A0A4Q5MX86_9MICO|nr:septation protein SepH [Cellulomonas sp. HLT2-17]RYV50342.1 DUF3071 domain-containing protein [Cellulomonas sp. HLT2-17]